MESESANNSNNDIDNIGSAPPTLRQELFHQRILDATIRHGGRPALTDAETGESIDFSTFRYRSLAVARILKQEYGMQKGDIIMCYMCNNIHYPIIFVAGAMIGCSLSGVSASFTKNEVGAYIERTACRAIFTNSTLLENVSEKASDKDIPVFVLGKLAGQMGIDLEETFEAIVQNHASPLVVGEVHLSQEDVVLTALSSGTTGTPKCVQLTHANFNAATDALKSAVFDELSARQGSSDTVRATVALLPFFHASGFWALCYCLMSGYHSLVMRKFDASLFLQSIQRYKIDTINLVPNIINFLLKNVELVRHFGYDLSSVKTVLCGSAPIDEKQVDAFLSVFPNVTDFLRVSGIAVFGFGITSGYGMTEIVLLSHITPLDLTAEDRKKHANSCGRLLPGFEAQIVDMDNSATLVGPNVSGELWLRSKCVMKSYLNDETETRLCIDGNEWFHTGDIAYFDEDDFYFIVGRLKNMIKVNGMQVSPVELETVLLSHNDVLEAAVVGVPDESKGEVPKAFVVLSSTSINSAQVKSVESKIEEIRTFVHELVAPHKYLIGGIVAVATLPKTSSGKVAKTRLRHTTFAVDECSTSLSEKQKDEVDEEGPEEEEGIEIEEEGFDVDAEEETLL